MEAGLHSAHLMKEAVLMCLVAPLLVSIYGSSTAVITFTLETKVSLIQNLAYLTFLELTSVLTVHLALLP
jgi:uncharacterized membrane protein